MGNAVSASQRWRHERRLGRLDCDRVELPRRHGGGDHALSGGERRSANHRPAALGHRRSLRIAGRAGAARALAVAQGLAGGGRTGLLLLRPVLNLLQRGDRLHDGGALLGVERLTGRKSLGVGIAMLGVFGALASGLAAAPAGARKGELIMIGAVLCMSVYNVLSRPFIQRSSALGFLAVGMGAGALALLVACIVTGRIAVLASFGPPQWIAGLYLGIGGGALAFILWVMALQRASPTRVANTMTVNPIAAAPCHPFCSWVVLFLAGKFSVWMFLL